MDRHIFRNTLHPWKDLRPWQRHSMVLLVAGLVYVGIGYSFTFTEDPPPSRKLALHVALSWWSLDTWGFIFMGVGLLAILSTRWPARSLTWGYMALTGLSAAWSTVYFVGIWFGGSPGTNYSGGLVWALIAFLWWGVSGLLNPPVRR